MKPQEKVVTAQDVQSCLYYIHVNSESDDELLRSQDSADEAVMEKIPETGPSEPSLPSHGSVRRKPVLPSRPLFPTEQSHSATERRSPSFISKTKSQIKRKPISQAPNNGALPTLPARPAGPRPLQDTRHRSVDSAALSDASDRRNVDVRRWSEQPSAVPPSLPLRPYEQKQRDLDEIYALNFANYSSQSTESPRSSNDLGLRSSNDLSDLSLTLIRRYDNLQSNIGKVFTSNHFQKEHLVDILNPGYSMFTADTEKDLDAMSKVDSTISNNGTRPSESEDPMPSFSFRCQIHTTSDPPKLGNGARGSLALSPANGNGLKTGLDLRRRSHFSSGSEPSISTPSGSLPPKHSSARGFAFQSPWGGTCDFTTGVAGRSLKCRHTRRGGSTLDSVPVSELRFNLPTTKTFGSPAPKSSTPGAAREKRLSYFPHHRQRSSVDSGLPEDWRSHDDAEWDERLDLSLGQEHAGGGFGGRQAKLGKLIVEHEGLQMLDLVVAANISLWWGVYDKTV